MVSHDQSDSVAFTPAETHLISSYFQPGPASSLMFEIAYLGPAIVLVVIGLWHDSNAAIVAAFSIVLAFRVWAYIDERQRLPLFKSALSKLCQSAGLFRSSTQG